MSGVKTLIKIKVEISCWGKGVLECLSHLNHHLLSKQSVPKYSQITTKWGGEAEILGLVLFGVLFLLFVFIFFGWLVFFDVEVSINHRDKAAVNNPSPSAVIYKPCTLNSGQVFEQELCQSRLCIFKIAGVMQHPHTVVSSDAEYHKTLAPGRARRGGRGVA